VREGIGRKQLHQMRARMAEPKKTAPTKRTNHKAVKHAMDAVTA
jgi:hypothetical protein